MIKREIINDIKQWIGKDKIIVLKGPRQVGKTTIIKILKKDLEKKGYNTLYFSVDKELGNPIFENVKYFIKYLNDNFPINGKKLNYVFLDEFQYIKQAGLFMKVLFDEFKGKIQFIVSGSSSLEITKNSEFLTGRKVDFFIGHISFFEFINYKSENSYKKIDFLDFEEMDYFQKIYKQDIEMYLLEYLNYGGYPEICISKTINEKKTILKELVSTYIQKDIVDFLHVENISAFNNLIKLLSNGVGNLVNKLELTNNLNINYETLTRYLDILEGTYIFKFIKPYFTNLRKELSKMPKVFINDIGILNQVLLKNYEKLDLIPGNIIENFVYNVLSLKFDLDNIYFYRTISKSEIDFIILKENEILPIEVKYRNKVSSIPVAIKNFSEKYKNVKYKIVITKDTLKKDENNLFIPYYILPFIDFNSL